MTVQEKSKILKLIAEEIKTKGFIKLGTFSKLLDNNQLIHVLGGGKPKKWLQANMPEVIINGSNGKETLSLTSMPTPTPEPVKVPENIRRAFAATLKTQLETYGMLLHSSIPGLLTDWTKYRIGNERLGAWMSRTFKEDEFTTRIVNNASALFLPQTAADIDRIVQIVNEMILPTGMATTAAIAAELSRKNLHWESIPIAHNQTLGEWLMDYCTGITYTDASETALRFIQDTPAADTVAVSDAVKQAIVHRYIFLPAAGAPLNALREILDNPTYSTAAWKKQSANICFDILMGLGDGFLDDSGSSTPRMAFYTGLQTPDQQHIYCILVPNDVNSAGQPWRGSIFRYPGQNDPEGHGRWLCQRFGLASENKDAVSDAYNNIANAIGQIEELQSVLLGYFDRAGELIRTGDPIAYDFSDQLSRYTAHWDTVMTAIGELGITIPEGESPMAYVKDVLNKKDSIATVLDTMKADYQVLVTEAWEYLDNTAGALYDDAAADTDIARWDTALTGAHLSADEIKATVKDLLSPFQALRILANCKCPLNESEQQAQELAEKHFNAQIRIKEIKKYFIEAPEGALEFLNKIDDIENRLEQLQMQTDPVCEVTVLRLDPMDLVRQVLNSSNIHLIHNEYPAANEFEAAVITGDFTLAQSIAKDSSRMSAAGYSAEELEQINREIGDLSANFSTPILTAGINLARLQGNANKQAEKYLLLALALKDGGAANYLADLYYREGNTELLWLVYSSHGQSFSAEVRQQYLCPLISEKYIQIPDIIADDIIGFLSIRDSAALDAYCSSSQLTDEMSKNIQHIRGTLQIPFIRQIVFLDSELYRFIQQQENIESIQSLGIQHTSESLGDLLRIGNYPRSQDVMGTAQRLWHFVKDWNGLAETFAMLADDNTQKATLLWDIYQYRNDRVRMLELLRQYPELQSLHFEVYTDLLFTGGAYHEYFNVMAGTEDPSVRMQLQFTVAAIQTGQWDSVIDENLDADELTNTTDVIILLAQLLAEKGLIEQLGQFLHTYFDPIMIRCTPETIEEIVTAGGNLDKAALLQLRQYAISCEHTTLVIFLSNVLGSEDMSHHGDEYYELLWNNLRDGDADAQYHSLRNLKMLFPTQYSAHYDQLFPYLLRSKLNGTQAQKEDAAAEVAQMLTAKGITEDNLPEILSILKEFSMIWNPVILDKLLQTCQTQQLRDICLHFFHAHRDAFEGKTDRILCRLYSDALKEAALPHEYLADAEAVSLRCLQSHQDTVAAHCVCAIEELLGREPYHKFTQLYIQNLDNGDSDDESEDTTTELSLFLGILEDPNSDIGEYLQFCSNFGLFSAQDQETVKSLLSSGQEGALTEAESIPVLHGLYENSRDSRYLAAGARLPFRDNPKAYARLLFYGALHSDEGGISWKFCADYCEKFRLDDTLIDVLLAMLRQEMQVRTKPLQWYDAKSPFTAIRNLCNRPEGFPQLSRPESVRELLEEMCTFFIRIDANSTTSTNHNSLRTIIELAVVTGNEDTVTNLLMDKLLGVYKKLGLVFACHLLQHGRYDKALRQLQALSCCFGQVVYKDLIDNLSRMDTNQLERWTQDEASQMLMTHFILPDGNRPDTQMLRSFVMTCITQNKQQVGIQVAEQLIEYFQNDSICYKILFILCKDHYMQYQPQIQRALAGLYAYFPADRRSFYTRSRNDMLTLMTVTGAVMQQQGIPETIGTLNDFIHKNSIMDTHEISTKVMDCVKLQETILGNFIGLTDQQKSLLTHGLLASVTGSWYTFLNTAFEAGISQHELADYFKRCVYSSWGLARGILQVYRLLDTESRPRFLEWLKNAFEICEATTGRLKRTLNIVNLITTHNNIDEADIDFLRLPWEEHLVCLGEGKCDLTNSKLDSCYMWMWQHLRNLPQGCTAGATLHAYNRLAQDQFRVTKLYADTDLCFRQGEFALAAEIYDVLDVIKATPRDTRGLSEQELQQVQLEFKETFQARSRICRIFLSDPAMIDKFRHMKIHSCANIIIALLQSSYASDLGKVAHYFTDVNRRLCYAILKLVNPGVPDDEKLSIFNAFEDNTNARIILSKILSTRRKDAIGFLFTQSSLLGDQMATTYREMAQNLSRTSKLHTLLSFTHPIPGKVFTQLIDIKEEDILDSSDSSDAAESYGDTSIPAAKGFQPAFAMQARTALQDQELPSLESLRAQQAKCAYDDYEQQLYCARGIYYLTGEENTYNSETTAAAMLQFGQVYRNYQLSRLSASSELPDEEKKLARVLARQALLDMAYYSITIFKGYITDAPVILYAEGLQGILCDDFASIDELVDDYRKNRDSYQALLQLITDSQIRGIVMNIFNEIRRLAQHYEIGGPKDQNIASYRGAYKAAYDALEQIPFNLSWNEAKNTLLKHLMRAINSLDKRPYLDVKILNSGTSHRQNEITGILTNTGRVPAENISVQAIFGNGTFSDTYGYKELLPNEQICFAVSFCAPEDATSLAYTMNITYTYRDREYLVDPRTGKLELTDLESLVPDTDLYGAHKGLVFTTNAEGNIVSKGFYGRNIEKKELQNLAREDQEFCDYRSAVIQGFRRTGKTSLLHYFMEHINSKCSDKSVAIYVDCEGFTKQPIQKAFVTSVMFGLEDAMPQLSEQESWHRLKNMWTLPNDAADLDPDNLQFFYQALGRELGGKGVILIVDEVDRLFARVEETQGAASSLFPSLRAVQHNPGCRKVIHLLLCGSNNMLIYNQDGGKLYQLFEDFAKIKVGQLHKEDVQRLLTEPLAEIGQMEYHPEAIEWIWRYTGGLVWYTKLLGNAAVNHAKSKSRRCIYPIDVSIAFDSIINEQNCRQYVDEGCNDDAKLVLDAMATLSTRLGADVSISQLTTLLKGALSESQLDSSLKLLTDTLGLLERSVYTRNSYHFAVEIYRRFYRTRQSRFQRTDAPADRMSLTAITPAASDGVTLSGTPKKRN